MTAFCHYYAKADLPPNTAVVCLQKIHDELISLFASRPGIEVSVKLDIEASSSTPFPPDLVRAVKENASPANLDMPTSEFS